MESRAEAEVLARGQDREDGHSSGGEQAAKHAGGDLLAKARVDVAELAPLQRIHAVQRYHARLQRRHRRREHHVRAPLRGENSKQHHLT
jgi:hypothetical protein